MEADVAIGPRHNNVDLVLSGDQIDMAPQVSPAVSSALAVAETLWRESQFTISASYVFEPILSASS